MTKVVSYSKKISLYIGVDADICLRELRDFLILLSNDKNKIFSSPIISLQKKQQLLSIINTKYVVKVGNIINYLLKKESNLNLLGDICDCLEELLYKKEKVFVVSASELSVAHRKSIETILAEKLQLIPVMRYNLDPKLIGGFTIEYNNKLLDFSIKGILVKMHKEIIGKYFI